MDKKTKEEILDGQHWTFEDYRQRLTVKDWKGLLLNDDDRVIYKGRVTKLKAKNLGYGVVEVYKVFPKEGTWRSTIHISQKFN